MAGIVAIDRAGSSKLVKKHLGKIAHRGSDGPIVYEFERSTQGQVWPPRQSIQCESLTRHGVVMDGFVYNWLELCPKAHSPQQALESLYLKRGPEFVRDLDGPFALIIAGSNGLFAARDPIGVAPLYEGVYDGVRCYASEVKALLGWAENIREFPPGHYYDPRQGMVCYQAITKREPEDKPAEDVVAQLRDCLDRSVAKRLAIGLEAGAWLSGGLDSSAMVALARQELTEFHTFSVGIDGADDLEYARLAAAALDCEHHEMRVTVSDILKELPAVIYHLESFDALLVRSSVMNYLVGKLAADYVPSVFSGEGGDELFAGYDYLTDVDPTLLADELVDITNRLHNTALQRVDRCSAAHGLTVHTGFLDRDLVDFTLGIPSEYKIHRNGEVVQKWVLRQALQGLLPEAILARRKSKFWEGSGIGDLLESYASDYITDQEFENEHRLPDGSTLRSKEELLYYRLFRDHFGELDDLSFVGRTKCLEE